MSVSQYSTSGITISNAINYTCSLLWLVRLPWKTTAVVWNIVSSVGYNILMSLNEWHLGRYDAIWGLNRFSSSMVCATDTLCCSNYQIKFIYLFINGHLFISLHNIKRNYPFQAMNLWFFKYAELNGVSTCWYSSEVPNRMHLMWFWGKGSISPQSLLYWTWCFCEGSDKIRA